MLDKTVVRRAALPQVVGDKVLEWGCERLSLAVRSVLRTKYVLALQE